MFVFADKWYRPSKTTKNFRTLKFPTDVRHKDIFKADYFVLLGLNKLHSSRPVSIFVSARLLQPAGRAGLPRPAAGCVALAGPSPPSHPLLPTPPPTPPRTSYETWVLGSLHKGWEPEIWGALKGGGLSGVFSSICGRGSRTWTTQSARLGFSVVILCEPRQAAGSGRRAKALVRQVSA